MENIKCPHCNKTIDTIILNKHSIEFYEVTKKFSEHDELMEEDDVVLVEDENNCDSDTQEADFSCPLCNENINMADFKKYYEDNINDETNDDDDDDDDDDCSVKEDKSLVDNKIIQIVKIVYSDTKLNICSDDDIINTIIKIYTTDKSNIESKFNCKQINEFLYDQKYLMLAAKEYKIRNKKDFSYVTDIVSDITTKLKNIELVDYKGGRL